MRSRKAIKNHQKAALRAYRRENREKTIKELQAWFFAKYDQQIARSSISEILSPRYASLDSDTSHNHDLAKRRPEQWPELEEALLEWMQHAETQISISPGLIRQQARYFWQNLPAYQSQTMPCFSNRWLHGFQQRRGFKWRGSHDQMAAIRQALLQYEPRNIFNCDETGLYWKRILDRNHKKHDIPSREKDNAPISALFCCNADGSERLPIWFTGQAKSPPCFPRSGIDIRNLNMEWRNNRKSWMTDAYFEEWLRWLDDKMNGRNIALLMDKLPPQENAVQSILASRRPLENVSVIWLPTTSTSESQPLAGGIIPSWKSYWRQRWLTYMLTEYEAGRDPMSSIDVLKAILWGIQAWDFDIKQETIANCFKRVLKHDEQRRHIDHAPTQVTHGLDQLQDTNRIRDIMEITQFLNPQDEHAIHGPENQDFKFSKSSEILGDTAVLVTLAT